MKVDDDYRVKLGNYLTLLEMPYNEIIELLLKKYGPADHDYFSQYSYRRFLQGKIKSLT